MTDQEWLLLLHDWAVVAEYDGDYAVLRCSVCGEESLSDLSTSGSS